MGGPAITFLPVTLIIPGTAHFSVAVLVGGQGDSPKAVPVYYCKQLCGFINTIVTFLLLYNVPSVWVVARTRVNQSVNIYYIQ